MGDAVNIGRAIAHLAAVVGADVPVADIVAHDDKDVRLCLRLCRHGCGQYWREVECCEQDKQYASAQIHMSTFMFTALFKKCPERRADAPRGACVTGQWRLG